MLRNAAVLAMLASTGFAQSAAKAEFDVASIKRSVPPAQGIAPTVGCKGGPGTGDPTHLVCGNMSARLLVTRAYGITNLQLIAAEWLTSARFDLDAKVSAAATKEQVAEMLRNLLAERFHLEAHRESREIAQFDLVVAKNGPRLKRTPETEGTSGAGRIGRRRPDMIFLHLPQTTMAILASTLSTQANQPVTDATGLTGNYDVDLTWNPDFAAAGPDSPPELRQALQEQLGLDLKPKKAPLDMLVIDRMDKSPVEN